MAGIGNSLFKSVCARVNLASKLQHFHLYNSCMDLSKISYRCLPRLSGLDVSKNNSWCPSWNINTSLPPRYPQHSVLLKEILNTRRTCFLPYVNDGFLANRTYASHAPYDGKTGVRGTEVSTPSTSGESAVENTDLFGNDWIDSLKLAFQSILDAAVSTGKRVKDASDEFVPYLQQLVDSSPYIKDIIIPVGGTLSATLLAWFVMPKLLRRLYKYSMQGPAALLSGYFPQEQVPYEKSFWGALEDPVRYLVTFMAFTELGVMIAPTTLASQYITQVWRGAVVLSFVWFLHRWKTNVFTRALAAQTMSGLHRERLLMLEKLSSVGLLVLGLMATAEACGVAVQSILTVGGIGGVATAFAARDILGNVLSGLSMQFTKPFSMGDTIKAGSIEGQVVEMGLTTTSLLNPEKFPVIVPNSMFSSEVIVNKSRAQWRAISTKIPIRIDDFEKIPLVSEAIMSMLKSNPKVFLEKEAPYCFLSRIENSYAELTIGCNLRHMRRDELYATEQDILLQAARIIRKHGAKLGSIP